MHNIKFRQPRFDDKGNFIDWFYWGFIDDGFISPLHFNVPNYQYTDLKDKNGKEMDWWENDIIKATGTNRFIVGIFVIVFQNGCFYLKNSDSLVLCTEALQWPITEKIGNKWETPELLKEGEK